MIRLKIFYLMILGLGLICCESKNIIWQKPSWRMIPDMLNNLRTNVFHNWSKNFHQIESPIRNISKKIFRLNSSDLIFAAPTHGINITGMKPGDVIMETVVTSQPLILSGDNSTHKNVVDWFLGIVGLRPPDSNPGSVTPSEKCSKCTCGLALKHKRIVGGVETLINEYPWMVALLYNNRFFCGASLINNRYLLSAAHCVNGNNKDKLTAIFLDHDRSNSFETMTFSRKIKSVLRHLSYGSGGVFNNDIALLKLDEDVPLNGMMRPVCLPPTGKSFTGYNGVAVGWGATSQNGQVSTRLREVTVPIMSNQDCRKTGYTGRITDNMLCAGFPDGKKDSCQGDSGGPLHVQNGKAHEIVGIVSWGEGCAQPNYPGVYTRVNRYISWIKSNTKDACYC